MGKQGLEAARGRLAARLLKLAASFGAKVEKALEKQRAKQGRGEPAETRAARAFEDARFKAERAVDVGVEKALDVFADAVTREQERMSAGGKKT